MGVMITASHNPPEDNGLKLIDTDGGMLSPDLEIGVAGFVRTTEDQLENYLLNYFSDGSYGKVIDCHQRYDHLLLFVEFSRCKRSAIGISWLGLAREFGQVVAGGRKRRRCGGWQLHRLWTCYDSTAAFSSSYPGMLFL